MIPAIYLKFAIWAQHQMYLKMKLHRILSVDFTELQRSVSKFRSTTLHEVY